MMTVRCYLSTGTRRFSRTMRPSLPRMPLTTTATPSSASWRWESVMAEKRSRTRRRARPTGLPYGPPPGTATLCGCPPSRASRRHFGMTSLEQPVVPLVDSSFMGPTRSTAYPQLTSWFASNGFPMQYDGLTSTTTPENSDWDRTTVLVEQRECHLEQRRQPRRGLRRRNGPHEEQADARLPVRHRRLGEPNGAACMRRLPHVIGALCPSVRPGPSLAPTAFPRTHLHVRDPRAMLMDPTSAAGRTTTGQAKSGESVRNTSVLQVG